MEAKFTPGPWSAKVEPSSYPECDDVDMNAYVRDVSGREIAFVAENYPNGINEDTYIANARLIAAAPDLYEPNAFFAGALIAHEKRIEEFKLHPLQDDDNACITWPNGEQTIVPITVFRASAHALSRAKDEGTKDE